MLWGLLVFSGLLALVWRNGAIALFTYPPTLRVIQIGLIVLGIGWGLLMLDAWRIARPPDLARRHRLGFAAAQRRAGGAVVGGLVASAGVVSAQRDLVSTCSPAVAKQGGQAGRYNILLMGGDAGKDRTGLRPDSMTVASVDAETGRTVLISLPRNLEHVPFPASSPLHKKFPKGYSCADHSCMLNAVYTYAMGHKDLYPGVRNPGAQATKEAIEGGTGLKINYWALIDLKGFEALVDAVGGITIDVYRDVPIGGGHAKLYGYVEAGKNRHLDGRSGAVVRAVPLGLLRLRPDGPAEVRDERHAEAAGPGDRADQLQPDRVAGQGDRGDRHPDRRVDTMMDLAHEGEGQAGGHPRLRAAADLARRPRLRQDHKMVAAKIARPRLPTIPPRQSTGAAHRVDRQWIGRRLAGPGSASPKREPKKKRRSPAPSNADDVSAVCSA